MPLSNHLSCRLQHILDKYPIPSRRIIHQHMGDGAHQFAILYDGTAAHPPHDSVLIGC